MVKNRIEIFRHGEAKYNQEIVPLAEAADLTENGKIVVRKNAKELALESLGLSTKVAIFSSPLGRTLETSLIIRSELQKAGLETDWENGIPILIRRGIQEQLNFSNSIMNLLAGGGEWNGNTGKTIIDPCRTNPTKKEIGKYTVTDALNMGEETWNEIPADLRTKIMLMETGEQVERRMLRFVNSLGKLITERELTVMVTHDALIARLLRSAGSEKIQVSPGDRVEIEANNGDLIVRCVAGIRPNSGLIVGSN